MSSVIHKIRSLTEETTILADPKHMHLYTVFNPDTKGYTVNVTNPRKIGEKSAYVAYTVKVTNNSDKSFHEVDRRYSDFDWLCEHLKTAHPSCVVPQIPEKTFTGKFDENLMAFRARELMRFLQRILAHPIMSEDEAVQIFITADESTFTARRNRKDDKGGFLSTLKQKAVGLSSGSKVEGDPEPWFYEKADDVLNREAALTQMVQTVQRMINLYQGMIRHYTAHINSLHDFLSALKPGSLATAMEGECKALEQTKEYLEDIVCQLTVTVNGNLIDYIHELQSVNAVLERRVPLVKAYLSAQNSSESVSEAQNALDTFSNAARADIEQVCSLRCTDMQRFFSVFARIYKEFYTILSDEWKKVLGNSAVTPIATQAAIDDADGAF